MIGAAIERKKPMTKEDIQKMNLKKKTRKRTRKFEIDGVTITTTSSKVIYRDEESETFYDEHYSADRIKLVVQVKSEDNMKEVKQWVKESFSAIPNKNIGRQNFATVA